MGDDRSGPASALVYFASGVTADDVPDDVVRDFIRERATAVLVTIGDESRWRHGLAAGGGPSDHLVRGPLDRATGPRRRVRQGRDRHVGERGFLLVVGPDGDDVTMMRELRGRSGRRCLSHAGAGPAAAAARMAQTLGEPIGATVGYRVRLDVKVGPATRIEVVTEGVFTRMILDDPGLTGVAAVIFDEFHERSLEGDLGLALALDATALRPDLRLLVMSATLDAAKVAELLGDAPVIVSEGRSFAVETRYRPSPPGTRLEDNVADVAARRARERRLGIDPRLPARTGGDPPRG